MNRIVPLILAVALFMEQMDSTVIATSLPAIAADIGTSPIALKLALTTYLVALAIFIPASGWMADRFGAKRVFLLAIGVFIAGSLMCAAANSLPAFVVARFIQGMGGSMMTPVARLVLVRAVERSKFVAAMAWVTVPALVGPMIGPPVGGFLTTFVSWHWIFIINVPIGLAGIALSWRFLPDMPGVRNGRLDTTGFVLAGLACSGIVFGLSVVSLPALPTWIGAAAVAVGIVCAILYVRHALARSNPVLDLRLFANGAFRAAILAGFFARIGVGATPFLLPLMMQIGFGLSAFGSGLVTFVSAIGAILVKFGTTRLYAMYGFKRVLIVAIALSSASLFVAGLFSPAVPFAIIYGVLFLTGFVRSLMFTGINALVFAEVETEKTAAATAIAAVAQQISIALGVAIAGMLVEASMAWRGTGPALPDFQTAFMLMAAISVIGILPILAIHARTGAAMSGHGLEPGERG